MYSYTKFTILLGQKRELHHKEISHIIPTPIANFQLKLYIIGNFIKYNLSIIIQPSKSTLKRSSFYYIYK